MTTPTQHDEPLRTIIFRRRSGPNAFDGKFYVRGDHFENFRIEPLGTGRIPQDACDAVKAAIARMERDAPDAYQQAAEALATVSSEIYW